MAWRFIKSKLSVLLKNPYINAIRGVPLPHYVKNRAQLEIAKRLLGRRPCLIARVGYTEGSATTFFLKKRLSSLKEPNSYPEQIKLEMKKSSGFFPGTDEAIDEFVNLHLSAIESIDIYASWMPHDYILCPRACTKIRLVDLDPFFTDLKWTSVLKNKKVCFVSPFVETMKSQLEVHNKVFPLPVLPEMEVSFVKSFVTFCDADVTDQSWFDNLEIMFQQILETKAEFVIIGAGAYGLPLGYKLKLNGISAVVLGGSTQLLFGIRGHRWENDPDYRSIMNMYWVRPSNVEKPEGFSSLEISGGAYW